MKKINIDIYYNPFATADLSCGCCKGKENACGGNNCGECSKNSAGQSLTELKTSIKNSDVGNYVEFKFFDINKEECLEKNIKSLIDKGFKPPIVFIDGIARYSGGIRASLVYQDIKELLEDYYHVMI